MRLVSGLLILLFSLSVMAVGPSVNFDRLSSKDGLSNNVITSIVEDRNGFIWVGTFDGLNRFDGYEFKTFHHNPQVPSSLADNIVRTIAQDNTGVLWVGTDSGGLNRYDPQTQSFTHFRHDPANPNSLSHDRVIAIHSDKQGILWVATDGGGLNRYDAKTNRFTRLQHQSDNINSLSNDKLTSLHGDSGDILWIGTRRHGLNRYNSKTGQFTRFTSQHDNPHSLSHNGIRSVYVDKSGVTWVGTKAGLDRFDPANGNSSKTNNHFTRFSHQSSDPTSLSHNSVRSIVEGVNGTLWIGTDDGGINKYTPSAPEHGFRQFKNEVSNPNSLSSGRVNAIYVDGKDTLWVGTYGGGLNKYNTLKDRFGHYRHQESVLQSLSHNSVWSIHGNKDGVLWFGTDTGLSEYHPEGYFNHFSHNPADPHSLSDGFVMSVFEDSQGVLWVGTNGTGLNRYNANTRQFKHFRHNPSNPNSISNDIIRSIYEDNAGNLWFGTYGGGLNRYNAKTEDFSHFRHQPSNPDSISSDLVMSIYGDTSGQLWVATNGGGLNLFDAKNNRFSHFKNNKTDAQSLSDNRVWYIHEDKSQTLWIGTAAGLNQYNKQTGTFKRYQKKHGLANETILGLLEDDSGHLWVSTNLGISRITPNTGLIKNFNVNDGLQSNDFRQGSYFKTPDGELFFGGVNGFNRFFPSQITDDSRKPQVAFTDFQISNQSVTISQPNHSKQSADFSLSKDINTLDALTLTHKESLVSFQFAALDFSNPMQNSYAYRLVGWDEDWIYTDAKRRFATYTKLAAGDYVFEVKASNKDGYWSSPAKSLKLEVLPPPWKTWWAYSIYTLIFIAIVLAITRADRQKRRNERAVMVQLRKVDKLKDEFLANTSHELRTPLNGIIGLTESLIDGATGTLPEDTKKNLEMVVTSGKRLANLVNDILDFSKLKSKDIPLSVKATDLRTSVEVTLTISSVLVSHKKVELINDVADNLVPVHADENRLQQILFNLVGNAIKFTDEGSIRVTATRTDDDISVSVIDTGIGISEDQQSAIFDSFKQIDSSETRQYGGTGLGLTVTQQLVELHGGCLSVSTNASKGATFTFTLPVSQQKLGNSHVGPSLNRFEETSNTSQKIVVPHGYDNSKHEFHVLVVDDEPINQQVLTNHLASLHYRVTTALSGMEALEHINDNNHSFDLVLLDIMMPKMSGYEVARKIRENHPANELPIIMLTAKNQVADLVEGFSCGTNDYLAKPFSKDELIARIRTQLNLVKINAAYARFFPTEFLTILNHESILDVRLGDQTQSEMTILFLDIRSFTSISETMTPKQNFDFLNEYLGYVIPSIRSNHGFIDKYIGDAVMALFPTCPDDAINASIGILKQIQVYNQLRESQGQDAISIGIGLHTGTLMLGTIGDEKRMDGTVISDAVNLAARLEGLTKTYGTSLVISERCFERLSVDHVFNHRPLGRIQVKGKNEIVTVMEIIDGDSNNTIALKKASLEMFEEALALYYQQDFEEAAYSFKQVLKQNPEDQTAALYHHRSANYMVNGVDEDWNGTERMQTK